MNTLANLIGVIIGKIVAKFLWGFSATLGVIAALRVVGMI